MSQMLHLFFIGDEKLLGGDSMINRNHVVRREDGSKFVQYIALAPLLVLSFLTVSCGYMMAPSNQSQIFLSTSMSGPATDPSLASASSFQTNKVQLNLAVMAEENQVFATANAQIMSSGVLPQHVNGSTLQTFSVTSELSIPKGTQLIAMIDNTCVQFRNDSGGSFSGTPLLSERLTGSQAPMPAVKVQAYEWSAENDTTLSEIQKQAASDVCVIGVSNGAEVLVGAAMNDDFYENQGHLKAIEAEAAWDIFEGENGVNQDIVIAVIDTGVELTHSDLESNLWSDSNGSHGFDFHNSDADPGDDNGHGTHVAGLAAAASNNSLGVAGVMGKRAQIMAIKTMDAKGAGSLANVVNGIHYAIENEADVINLSLGSVGANSAMEFALREAVQSGVTVVVAAGNSNRQLSLETFESPASYGRQFGGVITVGSVDSSDLSRSSFSNYGPDYVEISAPGSGGVLSTYLNDRYAFLQGTSMSSPVTAGAVAQTIGLLRSRGQNPTPAEVEAFLLEKSPSRSDLTSFFKDGKTLNMNNLALAIDEEFPAVPTRTPAAEDTNSDQNDSDTVEDPEPSQPEPADDQIANPCGTMSSDECEMFRLINLQRNQSGLPDLEVLDRCVAAAQYHALDMAQNNYFSHSSLDESWYSRMRRFQLTGSYIGENIARGRGTIAQVVNAWMSSRSHRLNILSTRYKSTGIGIAEGESGTQYWVQCFSGF